MFRTVCSKDLINSFVLSTIFALIVAYFYASVLCFSKALPFNEQQGKTWLLLICHVFYFF